jgi:hypothetical protein
MPICNLNCETCDLVTNIVFDPSGCQGAFVFADLYTCPGVTSGANTAICPLDVNILKNCKGDYKITLLDDNGCNLDCLVLRCSQFEIVDIAGATATAAIPPSVQPLFDQFIGAPLNYTKVFTINANNLNLVGQYVELEESAYFYRQVCQAYQNLWCGAERNGIICLILDNVKEAVNTDTPTTAQRQQIWSLGQDLIKSRVVALKQLCECGKVCNDQFFPIQTTPCQALKGCCPQRH